jgi:hypothetical protein
MYARKNHGEGNGKIGRNRWEVYWKKRWRAYKAQGVKRRERASLGHIINAESVTVCHHQTWRGETRIRIDWRRQRQTTRVFAEGNENRRYLCHGRMLRMRLLAINKANQDVAHYTRDMPRCTRRCHTSHHTRDACTRRCQGAGETGSRGVWMEGGRAGKGGGAANLEAAH